MRFGARCGRAAVIASRLRQAAGVAVLAILVFLGVRLIPIYFHNQELQ